MILPLTFCQKECSWHDNVKQGSASPSRPTSKAIDEVEVFGRAAAAKATLVHGAVTFTDYLVLLEVDGGRKIANKVFYGQSA